MKSYKQSSLNRLRNALLATFFVAVQLGIPLGSTGIFQPKAALAAPICVVDTAGANDEPGQKDLTRLCVDYSGVPTSVQTIWNWDELGTNGSNTLDACSLFDTDGDGNINYAVCVTTENTPASLKEVTTYSCGDDKIDRCTSPASPISSGATSCTVTQQSTDPFTTGESSPLDTQGLCDIQLSTVGGANAKLVDVCSYPSAQPNSDPSDCVIARNDFGKVELIKELIPSSDSGKFNLSINGPETDDTTTVNNVGDGGTTGEIVVKKGSVVVKETAGTGTELTNYSTSIICRDLNGTGEVVSSGTPTGASSRQLTFTLAEDADVVCVITNTAQSSITIIKDAQPNDEQDFAFTTSGESLTNFSLDDDSDNTLSNTEVFDGLAAGSYSITEALTEGWDLSNIDCGDANGITITGPMVSINLGTGQNVTCTYTNLKRGSITVNKVTDPADDPTDFPITISGTGSIEGDATRNLTTSAPVVYDVSQGSYDVTEDLSNITGWIETSNDCSSLTINASNLSLSCTITNTKQATITIKKETSPDQSSQVFGFSASFIQGGFSLKDGESQASGYLTPDTEYTVSETSLLGWDLTNISCDGTDTWNQENNTASITPAAGEDVVCTFTNTQRGGISGTKYEANADGTTVGALSGWTIKLLQDSQEVASAQTDANGNFSFTNLTPGSYTLSELLEDTYTQIFAPQAVTLDAGEVDAQNDFGNFKNALITGYKWNDQDGNGIDNEEPRIASWEIQLKEEGNVTATTTTDSNGNYAFANLAPGDYEVCEVQQNGWEQTFPSNDACHNITIDISGETETANFGNQGRGTITVTKNLDTDGDGDIDEYSVSNWTWDIDSEGNYATGSTQNVAAGTYAVSEDQKDSYHVTYSSCSGEENGVVSESLRATVSAGEDVNCTFTNTRDTAFITVNKNVYPSNDNGLFDLRIDDTTYAQDVSDGGTTGSIRVPTGTYDVSEQAGTETDLTNYESTVTCLVNSEPLGSANATSYESIVLERDDSVNCTFTNTRLATITVNKDAIPDDEQDFEFTLTPKIDVQDVYESILIDEPGIVFSLDDDYDQALDNAKTINHLSPGIYYITEEEVEGWDLTEISCNLDAIVGQRGSTIAVEVRAGEQLDCVFTNVKRGSITIVKDAAPDSDTEFAFTISDGEISDNFTLVDDGEHENLASISYPSLVHGTYTVTEQSTEGWTLDDISCSEGLKDGIVEYTADSAIIKLAPGAEILCYFSNSRDTGTITVVKNLSPTTDAGRFNLLIDGEIYATAIGDDGTTGEVELATGTYAISETAAEGTLLRDYETVFVCTKDERPLISGFGTSIPEISLEKDQDIICTFTNNKPQVLGTELVNTGVGIAVTSAFAAALLASLATLGLLSRRQYVKVPVKKK